jgi:hypothetical protein
MKEALSKIIYRLILGKYPWIEDFDIKVHTFSLPSMGGSKKIGFETYEVIYNVTPDKDGTFTVNDELIKVEELTETLFKMIGPEHYQRFQGVKFYTETND